MIQLNYRDSRPIYEQIKEGLRRLVITGAVLKDEKLPSVRELAGELAINPNTIQRAICGRGISAAQQTDVNAGRNETLLKQFDEIVRELLFLAESKDTLIQRIEELAKGGKDQ